MDELFKHLINSRINESDLRDKVIPVLLEKGFKRVADLEFLEEDDLKGKYSLLLLRVILNIL